MRHLVMYYILFIHISDVSSICRINNTILIEGFYFYFNEENIFEYN